MMIMRKTEEVVNNLIKKYDDGSLNFNSVNFRKGAVITAHFGLEEGFEVLDNNELEWGHARIHSGVDRAHGRTFQGVDDVIMSPFDFETSRFEDYNGKVYGTLVVLVSKTYDFEFRIAHMFPKDILIMEKLKNNKSIPRNTVIGKTGNYGVGSGAHTHTEVKSLNEKNEILESLLEKKFGEKVYSEYSPNEIIDFYRGLSRFEKANSDLIFLDFEKQKEKRRCFFANKYLYRYIDFDGTKKTRYSTELLWNGL
jgi:murein DD-endopeptidase MepM/ murein hydrolase activator NlpD